MKYVLRLFIAGKGSESIRAFQNIKAICQKHFPGQHQLWVIDTLEQPELVPPAVVATPTLMREQPRPARFLQGDLSNELAVLAWLTQLGAPEHETT